MRHHRASSPCKHTAPSYALSRRGFISTMGAATAGLLVGGLPGRMLARQASGTAQVAVAQATTYDRAVVRSTMEALFDALGGLADIIQPGDAVGIKINLTGGIWNASRYEEASGLPVSEAYWTHPEVLRAVGELIADAGAGSVYVLEATSDDWASLSPYGYVEAAEHVGATFINLNQAAPYDGFATRPVGGNAFIYESLYQNGVFDELDCLVSLAKSKQHADAGVTHGMKNLVGIIPQARYAYPGANRREDIHTNTSHDGDPQSNLCRIVLDINNASPAHLVVNDAVHTVLGGEGPWHTLTPASYDTFVASKDAVAADVVATQVMGMNPEGEQGGDAFPDSINYLKLASTLGMGTADLSQIDVVQAQPTGIEQGVPTTVRDLTAYPNPFSTELALEVSMRHRSHATLEVYDLMGRRVRTLSSGSLPGGKSTLTWDGTNGRGVRVPAGMYLAILTCDGRRTTRKVARVH